MERGEYASLEDDGHRVAEVAYREGLVSSEQPTDPGRGTSRNARILEQEEGAEDVPRKDRVVPNISEDASHAGEIETIPGKILGNAETIWEQLLRAKPPKIDPRQYGHQVSYYKILARTHFRKALSALRESSDLPWSTF